MSPTHRSDPPDATQRFVAAAAAILVVLAYLTGVYVSAAMTGKVAADPRGALASHNVAFAGAFLLGVLGWTLPMVGYGPVGKRRLAWLFVVPAYANWLVTGVKASLHVSGVELSGTAKNDAVFVALTVLVVIPSFVGSIAWALGLRARSGSPSATRADGARAAS